MSRVSRKAKPVLAVVGHGRAGKDTAAEFLRDHTKLQFHGGCSWTARTWIARKLGLSEEEAWATRHEMRMEWYRLCNEYRATDPARLIRDVLEHSDMVVGIRDKVELYAARDEGLIDLIVWIARDVPIDPTVTFDIDDADIIVRNYNHINDFHYKLYRLAKTLNVLRAGVDCPRLEK